MRILWITNNPLPNFISKIKGKPALGGSWISPLAVGLSKQQEIRLAVVTNVPGGMYQKLEQDSVIQYVIPLNTKRGLPVNDLYPELIEFYQTIEQDFKPDVIHMHGTERYFGLLSARKFLKVPVIISIQGIITSYYDFLLGGISEQELRKKRSVKNLFSKGGILNQRKNYKRYIPIETEILKNNKYYFCRTVWDRSQVFMFNKQSVIFQGEELLRDPFYSIKWSLQNVKRHSVLISSGNIPIKGLHLLLKAIAVLKPVFPAIEVRIPVDKSTFYKRSRLTSNDYEIYLNDIITKYSLRDNISLVGKLDALQMAATMANSHIFVLPSFNENSPNSLGEAMMVGTPSVVSPVGGVPDMVQNNESALYAPPGDVAVLAYQIKKIFEDDDLALHLSKSAMQIANKRHDKVSTIDQYKNVYAVIKQKHQANNGS